MKIPIDQLTLDISNVLHSNFSDIVSENIGLINRDGSPFIPPSDLEHSEKVNYVLNNINLIENKIHII